MEIDDTILSQIITILKLLEKQLETYTYQSEKDAFIDGVHHTINMIFKSR